MPTWMVVEDEPDLYEMILALYEMLGVNGVSFTNGEEAVKWIEDVDEGNYTDDLPDVALIDIRLPGSINGLMIGKRLRQSSALGKVRIIYATAYRLSPTEEEEVIGRYGGNRLIYKPLPGFKEFKQIMMGK